MAGVVTTSMTEEDRRLATIVARERPRLRDFIRRRVPDPADVEDVVQEVFYELVRANRLLVPIEHVTGWLFQVARNRIADLFRRPKPARLGGGAAADEEDEPPRIEELLPSADGGPEAAYLRRLLLDELARALAELPSEQRDVFVAHELEGKSFRELSAENGVGVNTLLSRKRYAVLRLRERLKGIHEELTKR